MHTSINNIISYMAIIALFLFVGIFVLIYEGVRKAYKFLYKEYRDSMLADLIVFIWDAISYELSTIRNLMNHEDNPKEPKNYYGPRKTTTTTTTDVNKQPQPVKTWKDDYNWSWRKPVDVNNWDNVYID